MRPARGVIGGGCRPDRGESHSGVFAVAHLSRIPLAWVAAAALSAPLTAAELPNVIVILADDTDSTRFVFVQHRGILPRNLG